MLSLYGLEVDPERNITFFASGTKAAETLPVVLRERIASLPDGRYEAYEWNEYDGHGEDKLVHIVCALTVEGDGLRADFTGSDPQYDGFGNAGWGAVFGVVAGSVAAWLIVTRLMTLSFVWQVGSAAGVVASALVVTVGLGLAGTLLALNQNPAAVLRNL